jgi:hypothetical protein
MLPRNVTDLNLSGQCPGIQVVYLFRLPKL